MKPFKTIAVPHDDVQQGRLQQDVFAANLWEVYKGEAIDEYKDKDMFFNKTYETEGLKTLLSVVEKRLQGKGGDPVIQIQTPFGGGKTHTLIALYHKAKEWKAKRVVLVGFAFDAHTTLWGEIERQLTGKIERFTDLSSPGTDAFKELLAKHQPVMILMDEVLEYITKAATKTVGSTTLAEQTIAFMQELTEVASTLEKCSLVITLPSSETEHFSDASERLFRQLQKVIGRKEVIYSPVEDSEIAKIVRQRLFSSVNGNDAKKEIKEFIAFCEKEEIIPVGLKPSEYRDRFIDSYPFLPEVIDVLYQKWGSFQTFQRTRGVLRILSLVLYDTLNKSLPYVSLADFNLANQEIRQEMLKHIGTEYNGIIAADITEKDSGSRKVDGKLASSYKNLDLGRRTSTCVFMHSFSGTGGLEKGISGYDAKRLATTLSNPSSMVSEVIDKLSSDLFYMDKRADRYIFTTTANLNKILLDYQEDIKDNEIDELEEQAIKRNISDERFKVYVWVENSNDIPDNDNLKLILLKKPEDKEKIDSMVTNKGQGFRIYRNTLIFLCPNEMDTIAFRKDIRKILAYRKIDRDTMLSLTKDQKDIVREQIKTTEDRIKDSLRRSYRTIFIPVKNDIPKPKDLGIPSLGETRAIQILVYNELRGEDIVERVVPQVLKEKYLKDKDYAFTEQIYQASLKTPGELRYASKSVLEDAISDGVRKGEFGLGELIDGKPKCFAYKKHPEEVTILGSEIIIKAELCIEDKPVDPQPAPPIGIDIDSGTGTEGGSGTGPTPPPKPPVHNSFSHKFTIPKNRMYEMLKILQMIDKGFNVINLTIDAQNGEISENEYSRIIEGLEQIGIDINKK